VGRFFNSPESAATATSSSTSCGPWTWYGNAAWRTPTERTSFCWCPARTWATSTRRPSSYGFSYRVLDEYESPHTNPKLPAILAALSSRSMAPIQVTHRVVELSRLPRP